MSLATTSGGGGFGGGGGGGGMAMSAHANAMARPAAAPPPPQGGSIPGGIAPPVSAAALGADLVDKHQQALSAKQARGVSHLPLVAVDLYAHEPLVAMFPPKAEEGQAGPPALVGKMKPDLYFQGNNETAHKTLRKFLTKSKAFSSLQTDALANATDEGTVRMPRPHQWLGLRRSDDAPEIIKKNLPVASESGAIAEDASPDVGVSIANSTLDGSEPLGDDFDRAVFKVRLHNKKKSLAVLPEEGVQILLHQAQYHVAKKVKADKDDEDITEYPFAVALPAWQCHDASVESLMDAMGGSGVMFQRSICALAGALRPGPKDGKPNLTLKALNDVRQERAKQYQIAKAKDPDATMDEDVGLFLFGMTDDGIECTAVQVSSVQPDKPDCLFGDFKVLSNVSYQVEDPVSTLEKCVTELQSNLEAILPDMELPPSIIIYGSAQHQSNIHAKWDEFKAKSVSEWKDIPVHTTKAECVAMGTAVLGAVSHGRIRTITEQQGAKPKAILSIRVANVAPVAVGVSMNYHGGKKKKWEPVKTIFDFDRRVPAGPYAIDLKASECVIHRKGSTGMSDEDFLKAAKAIEGSKGIPEREEAAKNLRVQVYQKWSRDGEWKKVGDTKKALVIQGKDDEEIACEHAVFELSLGPTGIITAGLHGEGESVVQATVSARNSTLRYWIGIILAVAFFGGFLVKSYWEERVFERDTKRLLAYYKHVLPGSIQDGDQHNSRYLVWKYRGKKDKLWRMLEKKYGEPVLHADEWPDADETPAADEEEEVEENLDDEQEEEEESSTGSEQKEEPDL
ncbi:expressed unknown protein [Seminavis robusta]|uniref:Uncharacterized protein n=1 Tax=Seminavis robusta TaxID=568900 RepID=A0A9N8DVC4_9STRA|nr:expressed unknown protein [Seminavis robusta]|eukprot:Sro371_g128550.1 n/a (794) ;mRNA; f:20335-22816